MEVVNQLNEKGWFVNNCYQRRFGHWTINIRRRDDANAVEYTNADNPVEGFKALLKKVS